MVALAKLLSESSTTSTKSSSSRSWSTSSSTARCFLAGRSCLTRCRSSRRVDFLLVLISCSSRRRSVLSSSSVDNSVVKWTPSSSESSSEVISKKKGIREYLPCAGSDTTERERNHSRARQRVQMEGRALGRGGKRHTEISNRFNIVGRIGLAVAGRARRALERSYQVGRGDWRRISFHENWLQSEKRWHEVVRQCWILVRRREKTGGRGRAKEISGMLQLTFEKILRGSSEARRDRNRFHDRSGESRAARC